MTDENRAELVKDLGAPLVASRGWMKILGVVSIISGVLTALTIVGLIVAWLPIWMGVVLLKAGDAFEQVGANGDEGALRSAMTNLQTFFTISGVLALIYVIFTLVIFLAYGVALVSMVEGRM